MAAAFTAPAGAPRLAVSCRELKKSFASAGGTVWALSGIDLDVPAAGLTMLVGPSGCGKTTLISIVAGILAPDAGCCLVMGVDLRALKGGGCSTFGPGTSVLFSSSSIYCRP